MLEIGPGFGRWTQFLRHLCRRLILVDVSERCIASCRQRFAGDSHIEYIVNDGVSLAQVPDGSIDFLFSFDSLVHAEADAVGAYLAQAARKLTPGGAGFVHHSNLGAFVHPRTGRVRWFVTRRNWRAESMSANVFRRQCHASGLTCASQELINWFGKSPYADRHRLDGRSVPLTDCLSVFKTSNRSAAPTRVIANHAFVDEWRQAVWMADVYFRETPNAIPAAHDPRHPLDRKLATARAVQRRDGLLGVASAAWRQLAAACEFAASAMKARIVGAANRWFLWRQLVRGRATVSC